MRPWRRTHLGTEADRATFRTLHTASLAGPVLREGLTAASAEKAIRHLRTLLGAPALALTDHEGLLAWDGIGNHHAEQVPKLATTTVERGATRVYDRADLECGQPGCPVRAAIVTPLVVEERLVGTLQVFAPSEL
jgi:two-component system LytT family sensor kinase